jgi:hypothetical protein
MAKRKSFLNVKAFLRWTEESCMDMLRRNGLHEKGISLPPIDVQNLNEIAFFARAILRKHAARNTRKDVYVNQS